MKELSKKKKVAMCIVLACSMFFMFLGIGLNNCSPNSNAGKTYVEPYTKYTYTLSYGETKEVYFSCNSSDIYYVYVDNASLVVKNGQKNVSTSVTTSNTYYNGKDYSRRYSMTFTSGVEYLLRFSSNTSNSSSITFVIY